jgi:hypothetical protein
MLHRRSLSHLLNRTPLDSCLLGIRRPRRAALRFDQSCDRNQLYLSFDPNAGAQSNSASELNPLAEPLVEKITAIG